MLWALAFLFHRKLPSLRNKMPCKERFAMEKKRLLTRLGGTFLQKFSPFIDEIVKKRYDRKVGFYKIFTERKGGNNL